MARLARRRAAPRATWSTPSSKTSERRRKSKAHAPDEVSREERLLRGARGRDGRDGAGGGRGRGAPARPGGGRRGDDLHVPVDLTFQQAATGLEASLALER